MILSATTTAHAIDLLCKFCKNEVAKAKKNLLCSHSFYKTSTNMGGYITAITTRGLNFLHLSTLTKLEENVSL